MNSQSRLSSSSSSSSSYISLHKNTTTQLPPRIYPFSLPPPANPSKSHHHKHLLLIICLSLLPFLFYILSLYRSLRLPSSSSFGLVIDISHSHSQILVFRSLNEVSGTPFSGETSDSMWAQGLSGSDPEVVGRVVVKLLKFAKDKVPSSEWKGTKVQLLINAGGEDGVGRVLEECRRVLRSSGFWFRDDWASVLRGQDEGLYSWLAVNYALGYVGNKPQETVGVIVLGKSAMQVSLAGTEPLTSNVSRAIRLAGVSYHLYTQSLPQFGQDVMWRLLHEQESQDLRSFSQNNERTVSNPCIPKGYELTSHASDGKLVTSHGAGNFSACKSELMKLLNGRRGKCVHPACEVTPILDELERKPHPQQKFFLTSELRGLVPKAFASDMEVVGQHFCDDDWETLNRQYAIDSTDLSRRCFSYAFMTAMLQNSFRVPLDDKRVEFAAGSTQIDWRLGAFLSQSIVEPLDGKVEDQDTQIVGKESITYLLLFAVALVFILLVTFFVMKLRKPQYKTIYDLEKGRYIVTRVPR